MIKTYLQLAFSDLIINSVIKFKKLNTGFDVKITDYLKSSYKDRDVLLNFINQEKIKKDKLKLRKAFDQTKLLPEDGDELSEVEVNKYEIKRIF